MFISDVARRMGFGEEAVGEIELCVDEACANVIEHAYKDLGDCDEARPTHLENTEGFPSVGIKISIAQHSLTITVSDKGKGAQGQFERGAQNLDDYVDRERHRGLGLFIIRKLMDDVNVDFPSDCGTRLTMTKLLGSTNDSASTAGR